jgi:hypothetical protein
MHIQLLLATLLIEISHVSFLFQFLRKKRKNINVRENRRDNQEWLIQKNWQHWIHKTHDQDKHNKNTT